MVVSYHGCAGNLNHRPLQEQHVLLTDKPLQVNLECFMLSVKAFNSICMVSSVLLVRVQDCDVAYKLVSVPLL